MSGYPNPDARDTFSEAKFAGFSGKPSRV